MDIKIYLPNFDNITQFTQRARDVFSSLDKRIVVAALVAFVCLAAIVVLSIKYVISKSSKNNDTPIAEKEPKIVTQINTETDFQTKPQDVKQTKNDVPKTDSKTNQQKNVIHQEKKGEKTSIRQDQSDIQPEGLETTPPDESNKIIPKPSDIKDHNPENPLVMDSEDESKNQKPTTEEQWLLNHFGKENPQEISGGVTTGQPPPEQPHHPEVGTKEPEKKEELQVTKEYKDPPPKPLTTKEQMIETFGSIWNNASVAKRSFIKKIWAEVISATEVKKWEQSHKSHNINEFSLELESGKEIEATHPDIYGTTVLKHNLTIQFHEEGNNKDEATHTIHFPNKGLCHRGDWKMFYKENEIKFELLEKKGQVFLKVVGKVLFVEKSWEYSEDDALAFWKGFTWK